MVRRLGAIDGEPAALPPPIRHLQPADLLHEDSAATWHAMQPPSERRPIFIADSAAAYFKFGVRGCGLSTARKARIVGCIPGDDTWRFGHQLFCMLVLHNVGGTAKQENPDRLADQAWVRARVAASGGSSSLAR